MCKVKPVLALPFEKSLLWPNSRCGACLQSIAWHDNLPLISYLMLRGRCRTCGQRFSIAYFLVELGVALGFIALFVLEVVVNIHGWPGVPPFAARLGNYPWTSWLGFGWHALLFSFLVVASVCDLQSREIPLQLTLTGTFVGLIGSALLPWPAPHLVAAVPIVLLLGLLATGRASAQLAAQYGLHVAAGHGLTYRNVSEVAAISEITEFNIGHNIVARAVLNGLAEAVREMRARIREAKA